ncbi:GNAT family N-acetyltransferase [Brevibacillus fortis]|uniref:GNAT family N-acetyltransferase n=1 Tax=Brevibacillus fortis TaxID=2126352 RepID=A0A2P7VEQ7_9BACL|nr:GNAT family N-acetyltransferase [Brevibacillus fortis]PSJ97640.1 GNAT family N-acetyltransferase [Brevibacillus fortis]
MVSQLSTGMIVRNFQKEDFPLLGELYQAVTAKVNTTFWWVGEEANWRNVFCAFENGKMIAKGQVGIINTISPGRSEENKHSIYVNLKTVPERDNDDDLLENVYQHLFQRALQLKEKLPGTYQTMLCVGNDSSETENNRFFTQMGYKHLNSLFQMKRDLLEPIPVLTLDEDFDFSYWKMESPEEEKDYLNVEATIWPDAPLGLERLSAYKKNALWTSMVIRHNDTIAAGLMAWREEDEGVVEDVFVQEPWRQRGFAKFLLTQALGYLKSHELKSAYLMVETTNQSALALYESVGFQIDKEEIRYYTILK